MDNYEGNTERTDRWIATYPQGRLETHIVEFNAEKGYVLVQAKAWRNQTEIDPAGIDYAHGFLAAYSDKMRRWMVEDTCTSALMRVMALVWVTPRRPQKRSWQLSRHRQPIMTIGQQSMAMCRVTKHRPKPSNPERHHLDHRMIQNRQPSLCQFAHMA